MAEENLGSKKYRFKKWLRVNGYLRVLRKCHFLLLDLIFDTLGPRSDWFYMGKNRVGRMTGRNNRYLKGDYEMFVVLGIFDDKGYRVVKSNKVDAYHLPLEPLKLSLDEFRELYTDLWKKRA